LDSYYCSHQVGRRQLLGHDAAAGAGPGAFDLVVAALPLAMMEDVLVLERPTSDRAGIEPGTELVSVATSELAWQQCFRQVRHTESQALRIWFKVPLAAAGSRSLGWQQLPPILSGYVWPLSTWEDNSQATHIHNFPPSELPRAIATVFGPLETGAHDIRDFRHFESQTELARLSAENFVNQHMLKLWPGLKNAESQSGIDWDSFIDLTGAQGPERLKWQHVVANVGPLEGYVQATPGTLSYRLRADESQFSNLFLAGDWTRNGIEVGSLEGAVISGLKAARAIAGDGVEIVGGDDFDRGTVFVNGV
jgi:uncharacterized protein with NAD-binding domain and iron-sulfur cluster